MAHLALPHRSALPLAPVKPAEQSASITDIDSLLSPSQSQALQLQQLGKRLVDIVGSGLGLLMLSPILTLIAILIKLDSHGPVFYLSERIGKDYQPFKMFKFRTMVPDADAQRDALRQEAGLEGELFKISNDPRITPLGKFLRATSLDELPQLINVFIGNMSLVGPRPLPADESKLFTAPYTIRFQVFPGITGAWQVNGRSSANFKSLCELEFSYIKNWTLMKDIKILLDTVPAVLMSRGAC